MRRLLAALVVLASASAIAGPKGLPPKLAKAARDAFAAAQIAADKGDLAEAARQYQRAIAIVPHPNAYFNLADVLSRAGELEGAIAALEHYLEGSPEAPDRVEVEQQISALRATPGKLEITMEEPGGKVFVDGVPVGEAPVTVDAIKGIHVIDVITPITFGHMLCAIGVGGHRHCAVHAKPREDGNVVISGSRLLGGRSWPVEGQRFEMRGRFALHAGRYEVQLVEDSCDKQVVEVPRANKLGDDVVYVYVTYTGEERRDGGPRCKVATAKQQRVHFE